MKLMHFIVLCFAIILGCDSIVAKEVKERPTRLTHVIAGSLERGGEGELQRPSRPFAESISDDCGGRGQPPCPDPEPDPPGDPLIPHPTSPACEDHDLNVWHGTFDYEAGCHRPHHYGVDPFSTIFAERVAEWERLFEGEKHEGYVFLPANGPSTDDGFGEGVVLKGLLRVHSTGLVGHMQVRKHTNRLEAIVCTPDLSQCGFFSGSQLSDYAIRHCRYKEQQCPRPDSPWTMAEAGDQWEQPPYGSLHLLQDKDRILQSGTNPQFWISFLNNIMHPYFNPLPNQLFQVAYRSTDAWGLTDGPDDFFSGNPPNENLLGGEFNHSRFCVQNIRIFIPAGVEPGFDGWTDDNGNVQPEGFCQTEGPGCNRFRLSADAPALSTFNFSTAVKHDCSGNEPIDFDICFDSFGNPMNCLDGGITAGWLQPALIH